MMIKNSNFKFQISKTTLLIPVVGAFLLSGCAGKPSELPMPTSQSAVNTTLTGTIAKVSGKFYINRPGTPTTEIDSYTIKLDDYVGKQVSITGQYSGTTLFVDTVK